MPEGPEVRIVTNQLRRLLKDATIRAIESLSPAFPVPNPRAVLGPVKNVGCHGKLIYIEAGEGVILSHLGMTGLWLTKPGRFTHIRIVYAPPDGEHSLYFDDQRRFGEFTITTAAGLRERLDALGPDVLSPEFTLEAWHDVLRRYRGRRSVSEFLIDQSRVAGVGNYLRAEILYKARLHPRASVPKPDTRAAATLYEAIRSVVRTAFEAGGNSISHYRDVYGKTGFYAPLVYKRERDPAGNPVIQTKISGRTLYWVPAVQINNGQ